MASPRDHVSPLRHILDYLGQLGFQIFAHMVAATTQRARCLFAVLAALLDHGLQDAHVVHDPEFGVAIGEHHLRERAHKLGNVIVFVFVLPRLHGAERGFSNALNVHRRHDRKSEVSPAEGDGNYESYS